MNSLLELVSIVSKNKVKSISVVGDHSFQADQMLSQLYTGLSSGEVRTEKDALSLLGLQRKTKRFSNLKSELKQRLINTVYFIDANKPSFTDYKTAYYTACRRWGAIKLLMSHGGHRVAGPMAEKLLEKCIHFEFTEIALDLVRILRLHFAMRHGDQRLFKLYDEQYEQLAATFLAENSLERHFSELVLAHMNNEDRDYFIARGPELRAAIQPLLAEHSSYRAHLCGRIAMVNCHINSYNYTGAVEECEAGIEFFQGKPYVAQTPLGMLLHFKLRCHLQLKQYEAGRQTAEIAAAFYTEKNHNYFQFQESYCLMLMHTERYTEALEVYQQVTQAKPFKKLLSVVQESWILYGAYLEFLITVGILTPSDTGTERRKFRLRRFLNEVPNFNREKRRMNIPVLILQILFLVQTSRYTEASDRVEAIEKYCSRYLKSDHTYRSNCFIKMLLQIPQATFHNAAVERKAQKYLKRLTEREQEVTSQSWEVEIVPYEKLWEYTLLALKNGRTRRQRM